VSRTRFQGFIADAKVTVISASTNVRRETDASGECYLANLPPGAYQFEIEKSRFKRLIASDPGPFEGATQILPSRSSKIEVSGNALRRFATHRCNEYTRWPEWSGATP
jgi:hypothetical protein